jgi:hypothetical protein
VPTNQLRIKASFSKPSGEFCVRLKNLILQGCSFQKDSICEPKSEAEFEEIPVLYVYYNEEEAGRGDFFIPFYTDTTRSTLLSNLPLACSGNSQKLVLASAALLLKDI